jgi:hypothetical protein
MMQESGVGLILNKKEDYLGKIAYQVNQFDDNNYVACAYAWGLMPFYQSTKIKISGGYGFNYSNSSHSRFESVSSLTQLLSGTVSLNPIAGKYNPYFTPLSQQIHTLLFKCDFNTGKKIKWIASFGYGLYAQSNIPYVYIDQYAPGSYTLSSGSAPMTFTPIDASIKCKYTINPLTSLEIAYTYLKNNFYTSHTIGAKINWIITHGNQ